MPSLLPTFHSIRAAIWLGFAAMAAITLGLAGYGIQGLSESARLVVQTYDKPLMAINYARSALANFSTLQAISARLELAEDRGERLVLEARMEQTWHDLAADLDVVAQRTLSRGSQLAVDKARASVADWRAVHDAMARLSGGGGEADWRAFDRKAGTVREQLDILVNLAAGDGFLGRQRAIETIQHNRQIYIACTVLALLLSLGIVFFLVRLITGPVRAASAAAVRIAAGELDTPIPAAPSKELGGLLRSMDVMRDNIRTMVAREVALRRTAQGRLSDAVESSREGLILVDAGGRLSLANKQVALFFPSLVDRFLDGSDFRALTEAADQRGVLAAGSLRDLLRPQGDAGESVVLEVQLAQGPWLRVSRSDLRDGGFAVLFSDITQLKDREGVLKAAKEAAEKANRTKTEFLTNMSHELRTPLNAIIGFTEMMCMEVYGAMGDARYGALADDVLHSGRHLLDVINDILALARTDAGKVEVKVEPVAVADLFEECRKIVRAQCSDAGLTLRIENENTVVMADPVKCRQVLLNLLSNAIKFTPAGGCVTMKSRMVGADRVALSVSDNGIGMTPEGIAVALTPFGQVDSSLARKYEGTGLGLPLTKAFVELQGGQLAIESRPGMGTEVEIILLGGSAIGRQELSRVS